GERHKRTTAGPKSLSWSSRFDALMHPRWFARGILTHGMPRFENVVDFVPKHRRGFFDSAHWIRSQMDRALCWETVARIRERWPRKLVIKGLLDVDDIARAAEIGPMRWQSQTTAVASWTGRLLRSTSFRPHGRRLATGSRSWWMAA